MEEKGETKDEVSGAEVGETEASWKFLRPCAHGHGTATCKQKILRKHPRGVRRYKYNFLCRCKFDVKSYDNLYRFAKIVRRFEFMRHMHAL